MADDKDPKETKRKQKAEAESSDQPAEEVAIVDATAGPVASDDLEPPAVVTVTVADVNRSTFGEVLLHFPERDVAIVLDGATAARVVAAFAQPRLRSLLQDRIDVETSVMTNLWASFDLSRLLGVSWLPGLPSEARDRMTIDPPLPVHAR